MFKQRIKEQLPEIIKEVEELFGECKGRLEEIYNELQDETKDQAAYHVQLLVCGFGERYVELMDGRSIKHISKEIIGGSRILALYKEYYKMLRKQNPLDYFTENEIKTALINVRSNYHDLLIPEEAARLLLQQYIPRFEKPSILTAANVRKEMLSHLEEVYDEPYNKYPELKKFIIDNMTELMDKNLKKAINCIKNIFASEKYINFGHDDFKYFKKVCIMEEDATDEVFARLKDILGIKPKYFTLKREDFQLNKDKKSYKYNAETEETPNINMPNYSYNMTECRSTYDAEEYIKPNSPQIPVNRIINTLKVADDSTARQKYEVEVTKRLIICYFSIVRKQLKDIIPKHINCFLIDEIKKMMNPYLSNKLRDVSFYIC